MSAFFRMILILAVLICGTQASAQDQKTRSDVSVSLVSLSVDGTPREDDFVLGDAITAEILIKNTGEAPVALRRIAILTSGAVSLLDPVSDGIDNNNSGTIDDDSESFHRFEREGAAWRMFGEGLRLEAGSAVRRRFIVKTLDNLIPGTSAFISISAGTTLLEQDRKSPRVTKRIFPLPFLSPDASLAVAAEDTISVLNPPEMAAKIILPAGTLPMAAVTITLPPALTAITPVSISTGKAIKCTETPQTTDEYTALHVTLGNCIVTPQPDPADRTIMVTVKTTLKDASPTSSIEAVREWRQLKAGLSFADEGVILAKARWEKTINGPLPLVTRVSFTDAPLKPGDPVEAQYKIENRGDRPLISPRITLNDPAVFACNTLETMSGATSLTTPCANPVPIADQVTSGQIINVKLRAKLLPDALITKNTALTLVMRDETLGEVTFPSEPLLMDSFDNPAIALAEAGEANDAEQDVISAIGESVRLNASGAFPRGRYEGGIRLIARVVNARTGEPVGPAPFLIKSAMIEVPDHDVIENNGTIDAAIETDGLWSTFFIPVDLRAASKFSGVERRWTGAFEMSFPDNPILQEDRVVEVSVETTAYENRISSSFDDVQVLIVEPDVVAKLFTLDDDRTIQPGETFTLVGMVCNYGGGDAYGVDVQIDLPEGFKRDTASLKDFLIPLDIMRDGYDAELVVQENANPDLNVAFGDRQLRASLPPMQPLEPEKCVGIELTGGIEPDRSGLSDIAEISISHAPILSSLGETRRTYPTGTIPGLRLQIPAVKFGPSAKLTLTPEGEVEHSLILQAPDYIGPYTLDLDTNSSARLPWTIFQSAPDGSINPWQDGAQISGSDAVSLMIRASTATDLPLGWTDTTSVRATLTTADDKQFTARVRIVTKAAGGSTAEISTEKRMALDRNCNGVLSDETAQDALFEPGKDILPGECVIVRIGFSNTGKSQVERIVIRDAVAAQTQLMADSVNVRIIPEPLDQMIAPDLPSSVLEWQFEGLFRPGAVGEVEYALRLVPTP